MEEGIAWSPIEYFNNKIVCDLIESKASNFLIMPRVLSYISSFCKL